MKKMIEFKNSELVSIANALNGFKLKGKASLGRTRLIEKLTKKNDEFITDQKTIQKKYFQVGKDGEFAKDQNDKLVPIEGKDEKDAQAEFDSLVNEKIGIDFSEYSERMLSLKKSLDNYDYEMSGMEANVYGRMFDELEEAFKKEGK